MELIDRTIRLDLLRPAAWSPESFSPASFERLTSALISATSGRTDVVEGG